MALCLNYFRFSLKSRQKLWLSEKSMWFSCNFAWSHSFKRLSLAWFSQGEVNYSPWCRNFPLSDERTGSLWRRTGTTKNIKGESIFLVTFLERKERQTVVNKPLRLCLMGPIPNCEGMKITFKLQFPSNSRSEPLLKQKHYLWNFFYFITV